MGKIKVKRKSTLIDMTAMSDVTVLLLTFFMLTSTFMQKEPINVSTPPSVSQEEVPESHFVQVLVAADEANENTKVFLSIKGGDIPSADQLAEENRAGVVSENDLTDETIRWSSDDLRLAVIKSAVAEYESVSGKDLGLTPDDMQKFAKLTAFGVPMDKLKEFLQLDSNAQDAWLGDMNRADAGIPLEDKVGKNKQTYNEFEIWMTSIRKTANPYLTDKIKKGDGIVVKADAKTTFSLIRGVLDHLVNIHMNKFRVMTALKESNSND